MKAEVILVVVGAAAALGVVLFLASGRPAAAHCDTMDGPVVMAARAALESGRLDPVLKWVRPDHEAEVKAAFEESLRVRKLSPEARELADRCFFETVVRLHRAGEGDAYAGLKPAGSELSPAIAAADKALESGSPDHLIHLVAGEAESGLRERFARAVAAKKHADDSVEAGREYVEAYVQFVHYAERLYDDAAGAAGHAHAGATHAGEGENHWRESCAPIP